MQFSKTLGGVSKGTSRVVPVEAPCKNDSWRNSRDNAFENYTEEAFIVLFFLKNTRRIEIPRGIAKAISIKIY